MKVRNGFVSNSSTSSFCVFGVQCGFEELAKKLQVDIPDEMKMDGCYHSFDHRQKVCPQCGKPTTKTVTWEEYVDYYGEEDAWSKFLSKPLKEHGLELHCYNDEYNDDDSVYVGCSVGGKGQEMIDELTTVNEAVKKFFGKEAETFEGTYAC